MDKSYIIAEAGSNAGGNLENAYKLVEIAAESGADCIKFQHIVPERLYLEKYFSARQKIYHDNEVIKVRQGEIFSLSELEKIFRFGQDHNIDVAWSVFDSESAKFFLNLGVKFIKVASSDANNKKLLTELLDFDCSVFLSTGMCSIDEIRRLVEFIGKHDQDFSRFSIFHCVSLYPCQLADSQLWKLNMLLDLPFTVGYSDHVSEHDASIVAHSRGVRLFEKHFTFDKSLSGFDHRYAMDPTELKSYVCLLRTLDDLSFAPVVPEPTDSLTAIRARRGVYAKRKLGVGETISEKDLLVVRPASRISAWDYDDLLGKTVGQSIEAFQGLEISGSKVLPDEDDTWTKARDFWRLEMQKKGMA